MKAEAPRLLREKVGFNESYSKRLLLLPDAPRTLAAEAEPFACLEERTSTVTRVLQKILNEDHGFPHGGINE